MTLTVHTARIFYRGPDRLDVTRKSAGPDGIVFAPSWAILGPVLAARKDASILRAAVDHDGAVPMVTEAFEDAARLADAEAWAAYVPAYVAEMRASYRTNRAAWEALLARETVTLVCYCADAERCHRRVLAGILGRLGASDAGERSA